MSVYIEMARALCFGRECCNQISEGKVETVNEKGLVCVQW